MGFTTDYEDNKLLPEGAYECIIKRAFVNATQGGSLYFSVRLIVRNDVPQKYQNRNIYHAIWQKRPENQTTDDKKVDGYSFKQLMSLAQSAGLPKGKSYETLDDMGKDLEGKCVLVTTYHDEYNGKTSDKVKWVNETKYPDCHHQMKENNPQPQSRLDDDIDKMIDVTSDDDLPFD